MLYMRMRRARVDGSLRTRHKAGRKAQEATAVLALVILLLTWTVSDWNMRLLSMQATTTTCESLLMGVPCITLAGHCHAHNVSKSLLSAVGLCDGWLVHSRQEYVRLEQPRAEHEALAALRGHTWKDSCSLY
jgi:hypothetical protein